MSRIEKVPEKLRQNPKNVRPEQLDKVLLRLGFEKRAAKGSHSVYKKKGHRPLTIVYW